mgnify:CR=1 FL=1
MTTAAQPPAPSTRAIAPDVARGLMLLMIALANAPWLAFDVTRGFTLSHAKDAEGLDLAWQLISIIAIDGRSYPLFAFLFGYGIWQLYRRQYQSGTDERSARRLLQRRHLWMLAFGALHALLLWYGDIIGAYGLTGLIIVAALLGRSDKALKITAWILAGLIAMGAVFSVVSAIVLQFLFDGGIVDRAMFETGGFDPFALLAIDDYGLSMVVRLGVWVAMTIGQVLFMTVPLAVILGILAARRGLRTLVCEVDTKGDLADAAEFARWCLARQEELGGRFRIAVVAAGATQPDGSLRFAVEDLLAAGAVIDAIAAVGIDHQSPEAAAAASAYLGLRRATRHLLTASATVRETGLPVDLTPTPEVRHLS